MRVDFVRLAVRRPARVTDAGVARERIAHQALFEILQFAFGAAARQMVAFQGCNARGIVAAIFQAFERIHQLLRDRSASENADNAAHTEKYPPNRRNLPKQRHVPLTGNAAVYLLNKCCGLRQS